MVNKEMNMIITIMGIIGVIFCLIALLTPWGSPPGGSFFTFGTFSESSSSAFYITAFESGVGESIFFGIAMILIFILTLVSLILGALTIKNIGIKANRFLTLGILLIINIILYVIAMSVLVGRYGGQGFYSIGFVMALIASIMFFVIYGLQKAFMPAAAPAMYQPQPPAYQQPQQKTMYTQQPPVQQAPPPQPQAQPQPQQQTQPPAQKTTKAKARQN